VNLWMKRAIGVAALGGGLLALGAGSASAREVSADASARVGRSTSAEVRVCADGRVLSRLLGSCGQAGSGTSATVQAGRGSGSSGIRARARVPRLASADVSIGARRSRPAAGASGQASVTRGARTDAAADTSPRADGTASLSRPRAGRLLDLRPVASPAGVGLLGSGPFTLVGDPASDNLLPTGELTLDGLTGEAPAGIGVLGSGPIASGNQVAVDAGDVSPSVPLTVCGNGVGALGDSSASCGTALLSGGNGTTQPSGDGGGSTPTGGTGDGTAVGADGVTASVPVTACGNGVGLLGDVSAACGSDTSTGGIIAPPPDTPGETDTGTSGTSGIPGSTTGTSGLLATGLTPGGGGAGDPVASFAPLRPLAAGSGALPFTGAASDLLAVAGAGLLAAGFLVVRATRPDTAGKGGGDR
jgi:hypothetical protein